MLIASIVFWVWLITLGACVATLVYLKIRDYFDDKSKGGKK